MTERSTDESVAVSQLLEEESVEEEEFRWANQNATHLQPGAAIGLVHSPTTDTLDSVLLDPPSTYHDFDESADGVVGNSREISPAGPEGVRHFVEETTGNITQADVDALAKDVENINVRDVKFSFEGPKDNDSRTSQNVTQPSLSSYFGADANMAFNDNNFFDTLTTGESVNLDSDTNVETDKNIAITEEFIQITDSANIPNVGNYERKDSLSSKHELEIGLTDIEFNDTELVHSIDNFESLDQFQSIDSANEAFKDVEDVNIESVNFEMDLSADTEETAPRVDIQEKDEEDFESFTADLADLETMDALGMSPAAPSFMTERNIQDYFRQTSQADSVKSLHLTRHSSGSSTASQDVVGIPPIPARQTSIAEENATIELASLEDTDDTSSTSVPPSVGAAQEGQMHKATVDTPSHQPMFPASTTQLPLGDSPLHRPTSGSISEHTYEHTDTRPISLPPTPEHHSGLAPFQTFVDSSGLDDPFSASVELQMSDSDRCHDAWLPSEATKNILITIATSPPGTYVPDRELLCSPSLVVTDPMGDPVRDLVYRYMGEQEALKRQVLTADAVTQDVDGLKQLIAEGCWRSAIDLTGKLLADYTDAIHSTDSLQLWHCRFSLLMKLRLYSIVESEMQAFQTMDTPDIYYEYYPGHYPGKRDRIPVEDQGQVTQFFRCCMVPFGMRLLHAELPQHMGRSTEALDRYYYILAICHKILSNLADGVSEDGSAITISAESRTVSQDHWLSRERRVLYCIANTLVSIRDYDAALSVYDTLLVKDAAHKLALLSGMGRIHLQMGNLPAASDYFEQVASFAGDNQDSAAVSTRHMNRGFESMCQNNFPEAYQNFKTAVQVEPSNTSAVNNMSVCCLYLGKLKEALKSLEALVHSEPDKNLHEGILFNLCTLYELESSRALHKKQALLDLVSKHKGDGFPTICLKMA